MPISISLVSQHALAIYSAHLLRRGGGKSDKVNKTVNKTKLETGCMTELDLLIPKWYSMSTSDKKIQSYGQMSQGGRGRDSNFLEITH